MMSMKRIYGAVLFFSNIILWAQVEIQKIIQRPLIDSLDAATIELRDGHFQLDSRLSLTGKQNIAIEGAGGNKTISNFNKQFSGADESNKS